MNHPEKRKAKSIDMPGRCRRFTKAVYSGLGNPHELWAEMNQAQEEFNPPEPEYKVFIGEMHGHTNLSDGIPDIDTYFINIRDKAKLDFAAVTDHDHGGVGHEELWVGNPSKWDLIKQKVKEYYIPNRFTTLLAYERDSYPFYNNMVIYYGTHDGEMVRGAVDGEITEKELQSLLARRDLFVVPHDTYSLSSGADFSTIPTELIAPFIEIYSRGDAAEYMGNPANCESTQCSGGWWQDALARGARIGCIAGSDDHCGMNGQIIDNQPYPYKFPGLTGVLAKENTLESIFEALLAKRCYAFMGGRIEIDFRINGKWMGDTLDVSADEDLNIWYNINADANIRQVTVVKNCHDYCIFKQSSMLFFEYKRENTEDFYYLRVELEDGRFAWTSPIWIKSCK